MGHYVSVLIIAAILTGISALPPNRHLLAELTTE